MQVSTSERQGEMHETEAEAHAKKPQRTPAPKSHARSTPHAHGVIRDHTYARTQAFTYSCQDCIEHLHVIRLCFNRVREEHVCLICIQQVFRYLLHTDNDVALSHVFVDYCSCLQHTFVKNKQQAYTHTHTSRTTQL